MDPTFGFIIYVILLAYVFDFINGFHDAANAIATIVTTGVLTPRQAVLWSAFFNFIAFLFFNLMVAKTIGYELVDPNVIDPTVICASLIGAIFWNLLSWYYGLPTSSSHALIGGLAGAAILKSGILSLKATGFIKVAIGLFLSPLLGILAAILISRGLARLTVNQPEDKMDRLFKRLQLASSALLSLTHGSNDAQKTMGIIAILLFSASWTQGNFEIPFWVVISCQAAISLGTLAGGWRIVHTLGRKITQLNRSRGCAAETSAAAVIYAATQFGVPVSTTQTVTGAITGVGLTHGLLGPNWRMLRLIFVSWIITLPASGGVAALAYLVLRA